MHPADYFLFFAYLLLTLALGAVFARRQRGYSDFFLAGRSMHWFPLGLSIMVTAFSAINYVAFSGEVFDRGLYATLSLPIFVLVALPVIRFIMPFYHSMGLNSAYEYLERRFDVKVRTLASGLFIFWRLVWMATLIYVPCKVLSLIAGPETHTLILLTGFVTLAYTLAGGRKAVMWSDVLQFFVLVGGILLGVGTAAVRQNGGLVDLLRSAAEAGLIRPFYPFDPQIFSLDPSIRITLWSAWLGTFVVFLTRYGADQVIVQHYFTARSLRHARIGFHLNYLSALFALLSLALLGFAIHAHAIEIGLPSRATVLPIAFFADFVSSLPPGTTGLLVAGLFAASMSSLDAGINSCAAAFIADFYRRWGGAPDTPRELLYSRLSSLIFGAIAVLGALGVGRLDRSIFEIANQIINGLGSPLLALFLLGMFSQRANCTGVTIGGILGILGSAYASFVGQNLALHYYAVLNLAITLSLCYSFSLIENRLSRPPSPQQLAWTWTAYRQREKGLVEASPASRVSKEVASSWSADFRRSFS